MSDERIRTVGDLVADLAKFERTAPIGFATSPVDSLEIASIYTDANGCVWADLEPIE